MNNETIVAPDMQTGLRMIKARFGEDALILDSRVRRVRKPGSLRMGEEVEIVVGLAMGNTEAARAAERDALPQVPLDHELKRLERIVGEIEKQFDELESEQALGRVYPLGAYFAERGLAPELIRDLVRDFIEEVPPVNQAEPKAAVARLRPWLNCVESMELGDLRGHHALLGLHGAGKSTLALKLAAHVAASGASVALIGYQPGHEGESVRLERRAEEHGFEAALAPDSDALLGAVRYFAGRDLLIIDLPGLIPEHWSLLDACESALGGDPLLRHLCAPADGGGRGEAELAARCDFLALTRCDLGDPLIPVLNLAQAGDHAVSFLAAGSEPESKLALASRAGLLEGVRGSDVRADVVGVGGRG